MTACNVRQFAVWRLDGAGAVPRLVVPGGGGWLFDYSTDGRSLFAEREVGTDEYETQLVDAATGDVTALPGCSARS